MAMGCQGESLALGWMSRHLAHTFLISQPSEAGNLKRRVGVSEFLVESLIPKFEVNLVAGPSGAGKTRWLLGSLKKWERGLPFLGRTSYPCKWAYAASDRSLASVHRTLKDIGIEPDSINIIPAWGKHYKTLPQIFDAAKGYELLVIEGFANYAEDTTSKAVRNFLAAVQRTIENDGQTLIGIVESPKMKPTERYQNPRQRVSGAAAWAHYTETIFLVEPEDVSDPSLGTRRLYVCPRNEAGVVLKAAFDSEGRLIF